MCCPGCQAVAQAIVAAGHERYYTLRTSLAPTRRELVPDFVDEARVYDNPTVQSAFVRDTGSGGTEATFILEGMTCAACVWLNEKHLLNLPGVLFAEVNYATQRARVVWDPEMIALSQILGAVQAIGYQAHPYDPNAGQVVFDRERRRQIRRLGVAGLFGMQVMMLAVAMYFGEAQGMDGRMRGFLQWISLALTVPVLVYAGRPFFESAVRDLKLGRLGMDVPVSLGLAFATFGSLAAMLRGQGDIYLDSVVMFVFFLGLARFAEFSMRRKTAIGAQSRLRQVPLLTTRRTHRDDGAVVDTSIAVADLAPGDLVVVRTGETIPADGVISAGETDVDEAVLTGESAPVPKRPGDRVIGGGMNLSQPVEVTVESVGSDTVLCNIAALAERAKAQKPRLAQLADRVAVWFVLAVLVVAVLTGFGWAQVDSERWLAVTVSVLVVTCPCALSLATPAAVAIAVQRLAGEGVVVVRVRALEALAKVTVAAFDKTGTLTRGRPDYVAGHAMAGMSLKDCLAVAAALETNSEHPLSRAMVTAGGTTPVAASSPSVYPGGGIGGVVNGRQYHIGHRDFIFAVTPAAESRCSCPPAGPGETQVFLADRERVLAVFALRDAVRPEAEHAVRRLGELHVEPRIISGDRRDVATSVAESLEIPAAQVHAELVPARKLALVNQWQDAGRSILAIGDGVNDAPVLAGAHVSMAMGEGNPMAKTQADFIALAGLANVTQAIVIARRTTSVIRQNLAWAILYNTFALPAAAAGWLAPWAAALGMSLSSLLVVLNALRLSR